MKTTENKDLSFLHYIIVGMVSILIGLSFYVFADIGYKNSNVTGGLVNKTAVVNAPASYNSYFLVNDGPKYAKVTRNAESNVTVDVIQSDFVYNKEANEATLSGDYGYTSVTYEYYSGFPSGYTTVKPSTLDSVKSGNADFSNLLKLASAPINVGTYAVAAILENSPTYSDTETNFILYSITPKDLVVTPNSLSKTYGDDDPILTYTSSGLISGDTISGTLKRDVGEAAGTYVIRNNDLAAANYTISLSTEPVNFTINQAPLTLMAVAKTKVYGQTDPELTVVPSGLKQGDTISVAFSGELSRVEGESVGVYAITSTLNNSNYIINFVSDNLTITPATLTIVPTANLTKIYDNADPELTYSVILTDLKNGDSDSIVSGKLKRIVGENVGNYPIINDTVKATDNYNIVVAAVDFSILPRAITVIPNNNLSKTYGSQDPALAYLVSGHKDGVTVPFSGTLSRVVGENVGVYAITKGSLTAGSNYIVSVTAENFVIAKATLTITANPIAKIKDEVDPALTYKVAGLKNGDSIVGALARDNGEDYGTYAIKQGTLTVDNAVNYNISFTGASFSVCAELVTVIVLPTSKVYGSADPDIAYEVVGLQDGLSLTGKLLREEGENVGTYTVNIGTLSGGIYIGINFIDGQFTITPATLAVRANDLNTVYGEDKALTYTVSGLVGGDTTDVLSGELARTAGKDTGVYLIGKGTLSAGKNYVISFASGKYTITPKTLSDELSEVVDNFEYNGNKKTPTAVVSGGLVLNTDYTVSYENNINAGTAKLNIIGMGNYMGLIFVEFTIKPKALTNELAAVDGTYFYTGSAQTPAVTIAGGLVLGTDFEISYSNNINVGTAIVTMSGKGNYSGMISRDFTINKASQNAPVIALASRTNVNITLVGIKGAQYSIDGTKWQDSEAFSSLKVNTEYTFYVRMKETTNYLASSVTTIKLSTRADVVIENKQGMPSIPNSFFNNYVEKRTLPIPEAPAGYVFECWMLNGEVVTAIDELDEGVTVTPVWSLSAPVADARVATTNSGGVVLSANVTKNNNISYVYNWYVKVNGVWVVIEGETGATLTVLGNNKSGDYRCEVTAVSGTLSASHFTNDVNVVINPDPSSYAWLYWLVAALTLLIVGTIIFVVIRKKHKKY